MSECTCGAHENYDLEQYDCYEQMPLGLLIEILYSYPYDEILTAAEIANYKLQDITRCKIIDILNIIENRI